MRESDIVHENGNFWVARLKDSYTIFVAGVTHSVSDSAYARDADGLSLAIARCDYLARRYVGQVSIDRLHAKLSYHGYGGRQTVCVK